ncbi:hypothetical protein [Candidatus Methanoperedens nitratireducens]|uniref:Uncharacterized protein n=1 Tax=Candidatus Methanoperedens nitratireducens TaxID=1392998 RepID=A0A284VKR1_9EURY|nr:hypothetical protein [Candidatus Methanoperedens nitroreducens]SNQ59854.1 hypothetical protein MNV_1380041 [Candidatus Methanoperedens nitroreducens]
MTRQIADSLRLMGHNVEYVAEKDAGISDDEVLEMANYFIGRHRS